MREGRRVTALQIADSWPRIPPGTLGTVESYDADERVAWIRWDNGFSTWVDDRDELTPVIEPQARR
jgi:hypothetical protein